jgi:hypothetical protein
VEEKDAWTRSPSETNGFDADSDEDQEENRPDGHISHPAAFGLRRPALGVPRPYQRSGAPARTIHHQDQDPPRRAGGSRQPPLLAHPPPPPGVRLSHRTPPGAARARPTPLLRRPPAHIRRTIAITADDIQAVFCSLRRAEIAAATPADAPAAVAAIKAHRTLTAYNWPTDSIERELHYIVYDSPAVL